MPSVKERSVCYVILGGYGEKNTNRKHVGLDGTSNLETSLHTLTHTH